MLMPELITDPAIVTTRAKARVVKNEISLYRASALTLRALRNIRCKSQRVRLLPLKIEPAQLPVRLVGLDLCVPSRRVHAPIKTEETGSCNLDTTNQAMF